MGFDKHLVRSRLLRDLSSEYEVVLNQVGPSFRQREELYPSMDVVYRSFGAAKEGWSDAAEEWVHRWRRPLRDPFLKETNGSKGGHEPGRG